MQADPEAEVTEALAAEKGERTEGQLGQPWLRHFAKLDAHNCQGPQPSNTDRQQEKKAVLDPRDDAAELFLRLRLEPDCLEHAPDR